jgi:hypothetical protein
MSNFTPHLDLHQECLAKLNRAMDLVLKTAETASAENNHKVVIQAAREVTRIATLITKMTDPKTKPKITSISPAGLIGQKSAAPPALRSLDSRQDPEAFFPPPEVPISEVSPNLCHNISRNFQEPQTLEADLAGLQGDSAKRKNKSTQQR